MGPRQEVHRQKATPLIDSVAAVSVGIIDGEPMLDLAYVEDVRAETDMNIVVTGRGLFVEVQGTAEGAPFDKRELDALLELGVDGCAELRDLQVAALAARLMGRIVLATHNPHKVEEFQAIVAQARPDLEVVGYDGPEPVEDGVTFAENALIKARAAAAHTGLPALADDSGIAVDVLGGSPGVFSAYWAGHAKDAAANLALLLDQLSDVADPHRTASFVSTIALVVPRSDGARGGRARRRGALAGPPRDGGRRAAAASATTRSSFPTASPPAPSAPSGSGPRRRRTRHPTAPARSRRSFRCSPPSDRSARPPRRLPVPPPGATPAGASPPASRAIDGARRSPEHTLSRASYPLGVLRVRTGLIPDWAVRGPLGPSAVVAWAHARSRARRRRDPRRRATGACWRSRSRSRAS